MPLNLPINNQKHIDGKGRLYVVATPIGNMNDITLRAIDVLGKADCVAAEDTRRTGRLLAFHKVNKTGLLSYHEHNELKRTPELIEKLKRGLAVVLVSDAGTPTVSDPGYSLIKKAVENGIPVIPIPGVSAVTTALSVAGLPVNSFVFMGFLARKKGKRIKQLNELSREQRTIVIYESPRRVLSLLEEIIMVMGDRDGVLCREMTKLHEEFLRGVLSEIVSNVQKRAEIKGECTLLIRGYEKDEDISMESIRSKIKEELKTTRHNLSGFAKKMAKEYGLPKNEIYKEALKIEQNKKV